MKLTEIQKVIVWGAAIIALVFCLGWARVVLFTDYRAHLHLHLSIAAVLAGTLSLGLFTLKRWAIAVLWFLALFPAGFALWVQVGGGAFVPFLTLVVILCAAYLVVLFPYIRALTRRSTTDAPQSGAPVS